MIFSIFRNLFTNIANLFRSKSATEESPLRASVTKFAKTVQGEAKKSVTRAVPTLEVVTTRFSISRKKYVKDKTFKKLDIREYAFGRDKDAVLGQLLIPDGAIIVNNNHVSKHHLSIKRETDKNNRDKYLLKYIKTTNGTSQRQLLWASLLFWQNEK